MITLDQFKADPICSGLFTTGVGCKSRVCYLDDVKAVLAHQAIPLIVVVRCERAGMPDRYAMVRVDQGGATVISAYTLAEAIGPLTAQDRSALGL